MLPQLAVFLLMVSTDAVMAEDPSFEYEDPDTGGTLLCALCPPGTYVSSPCSRTHHTVCLPCPEEHFTEFWNFLPKCLYCSNFCEGNQVVKKQCSTTHNRVCECKSGYYLEEGFCLPHTRCPPGEGANIIGNTHTDTQCERCPSGTFSAETSSSARCSEHTDCGALQVVLPGGRWYDSVCSSCGELTSEGGLNVLRHVLPGFFSLKKLRLKKLKRFARSLDGGYSKLWPEFVHTKAQLLHYISMWTKNAHTHQLKALPRKLLRAGLQRTAEKVHEMLTRIEEKVIMCRDTLEEGIDVGNEDYVTLYDMLPYRLCN